MGELRFGKIDLTAKIIQALRNNSDLSKNGGANLVCRPHSSRVISRKILRLLLLS